MDKDKKPSHATVPLKYKNQQRFLFRPRPIHLCQNIRILSRDLVSLSHSPDSRPGVSIKQPLDASAPFIHSTPSEEMKTHMQTEKKLKTNFRCYILFLRCCIFFFGGGGG